MGTIFYKGKKYSSTDDYKVSQRGDITTNSNFELLLSTTADSDLTEIGELKKGKGLYYNPYSKELNVLNGSIIVGNPDSEAQDYGGVSITKTDILVHNGWFTEFGQDTSLKYCMGQLNIGKVSKSGDTMSGGLLVQMGTTAAPYVSVNNGTYDVGLHIGSGGINHGVYDFSLNQWLIYNNGTNTIVNGRASENVLKTGDVITGQLDAKNSNVTIGTTSNNGVTSPTYQGYRVVDSNNAVISHFFTGAYANGDVKTYLQTYNKKTDGTQVDNMLSVGVHKNGSLFYEVSSPSAFRDALHLGNLALQSGAHFTQLSVASFDFKATTANKAGSATATKAGWTFVCWIACYSTGHTLAGDCYFEFPQNATTNIWSRSGGFTANSTIIKGLALFMQAGGLEIIA